MEIDSLILADVKNLSDILQIVSFSRHIHFALMQPNMIIQNRHFG